MRVLVTGATGFVGAWSAQALARNGHELTFLVRDVRRLATTAQRMGIPVADVVEGDITDARSVDRALSSVDAVVHCAAVVATDPSAAKEMHAVNLQGVKQVVGGAVDRGLDPIISTSSITALFAPGISLLHSDLDPARGGNAYGASKADAERFVRSLQAQGAPVVITYPGMVVGPGAAGRFGEVADGFETILRGGIVPGHDAGWLVIDVRDLAMIHANVMVAGKGPRRYMAGGEYLDARQITAAFRNATGRQIRRLPIPGVALRGVGSLVDGIGRITGRHGVLTRAAMDYYTKMPRSDDRLVHDELGIQYRNVDDTFADCIASLASEGRISEKAAGQAAHRGS